ncbi:MAG TPA: hypothetical protein VHF01_09730 [Candidatus Acidoferrum sp.]|nr:hypothetical protein [Candidatus Acidoferrum sp.]
MPSPLDDYEDLIRSAKDYAQAARNLLYSVDEIVSYVKDVFNYPLKDESDFFQMVAEFRRSHHHDNKQLFVTAMEKIVKELWFSKRTSEPTGSGEEFYPRAVFDRLEDLKKAVSQNDDKMAGYALDDLDDEGYFRNFLAAVSGATAWKVDKFQSYLLRVSATRRYLWGLEANQATVDEDLERDGLETAKQYLEEREIEVRMPWLTDFILSVILDALILIARAAFAKSGFYLRFRSKKDVAIWLTNMMLFRNEVVSRNYDARELIRRLRQHEDSKGTYVIPSLVYPLLELQIARSQDKS